LAGPRTTGGIAVNQVYQCRLRIVRLQTAKGDITQAALGLITGNSLLANAANGSVNLAAVANAVIFVSGKSGGSFRLMTNKRDGLSDVTTDAGALTDGTSGITSNGDMRSRPTATWVHRFHYLQLFFFLKIKWHEGDK